eukprot:355943-Chlamydomonas_euryale.AAC.6
MECLDACGIMSNDFCRRLARPIDSCQPCMVAFTFLGRMQVRDSRQSLQWHDGPAVEPGCLQSLTCCPFLKRSPCSLFVDCLLRPHRLT